MGAAFFESGLRAGSQNSLGWDMLHRDLGTSSKPLGWATGPSEQELDRRRCCGLRPTLDCGLEPSAHLRPRYAA